MKGNFTGIKHDEVLCCAMWKAYVETVTKAGTKAMLCGLVYGDRVVAIRMTFDEFFQRYREVKSGNNYTLQVFCPIFRKDLDQYADRFHDVCSVQELEQIKKDQNLHNLGNAFEYALKRKRHQKFEHTRSFDKGSEFGTTQVKFFNTSKEGSARVQVCKTSQLEKLGYQF